MVTINPAHRGIWDVLSVSRLLCATQRSSSSIFKMQRTRWGVRRYSAAAQSDSQFELRPGAAMFEAGSFANGAGLATHAALSPSTRSGTRTSGRT